MERHLALELVATIGHDRDGGVVDELATPQALTAWVRARADLFDASVGAAGLTADQELWRGVVRIRQAARALFARAVSPAPPSPADVGDLPPAADALAHVNAEAAALPVAVRLDWPADGRPVRREVAVGADARVLTSVLARAVVDFLAGPERPLLRACTAPRCVRYFLKTHGRQEYCKPSCGNRARVARHYQRHHAVDGGSGEAVGSSVG